jgi:uncharacterized membrane protein
LYMFKRFESVAVIKRYYLQKSEIGKIIAASCLFSVAMVGFRVLYSGHTFFLFLVWNLFLAYIPYVISSLLLKRIDWIENTPKLIFISIAWLLFIPNSFYIITDLVHLEYRYVAPFWYDLMLILSFVWNGILLGILSVRQMEKIIAAKWQVKTEVYFIYPVMFLNALGVYIGRYLRFNSWDVVTNPFQLASDIIYLFVHPVQNRFDWSMILCYSLFMTLVYITMKKLSRSVA